MTKKELANKYNITVEQLNKEMYDFAQTEGYDEDGNEYETLDAWLSRPRELYKASKQEANLENAVERGEISGAN